MAEHEQPAPACKHQAPKIENNENQFLHVANGPKGRGVFASREIASRTTVHVAPCIPVGREEYDQHMKSTILEHYLFNAKNGDKLLALGYGSLFNHSRKPNIDYRVNSSTQTITYSAAYNTISPGEELCINYGNKLWFNDAEGELEDGSGEDSSISSDGKETEDGMATFLGRMNL